MPGEQDAISSFALLAFICRYKKSNLLVLDYAIQTLTAWRPRLP